MSEDIYSDGKGNFLETVYCVICALDVEPSVAIPEGHSPYCAACAAAHNAALDEVLARLKELTFTQFSFVQTAACGQRLYKELAKLKFPEAQSVATDYSTTDPEKPTNG